MIAAGQNKDAPRVKFRIKTGAENIQMTSLAKKFTTDVT